MAEESRPWPGVALGDAGPYSDDVWDDIYETLFGSGLAPYNDRGVLRNWTNELEVTDGGANTADVDLGAALVHGKFYKHTAPVINLNIPSSVGAWREDLVCLQQVYAAQTTRIARHANPADTVAYPAPTQTVVTWEIPLAAVRINAAGAITLITDLREFLANIPRPYGNAFPPNPEVGDPFYRTDEPNYYIWNGTAWVLVRLKELSVTPHPASIEAAGVTYAFVGGHSGTDQSGIGTLMHFEFQIPADFVDFVDAYVVVSRASGTVTAIDWTFNAVGGGCAESYNRWADNDTANGQSLGAQGTFVCIDVSGAFDSGNLLPRDVVGASFVIDAFVPGASFVYGFMLVFRYE